MMPIIPPIQEVHTRELLKQLRWACHENRLEQGSYGYYYSYADLKKELATREHIPNKKEAKAIRKAKIRHGR